MEKMTRVLIIGGGSIGERHLRCFLQSGRAEVGLCELSDELRDRLKREYNPGECFSDLNDAIAAGYDAAVVCVPAHLHISMSIRLANEGIHLLIEKPLSTSLDFTDELMDVIRNSGIKSMMAFTYRSHPLVSAMKGAIASGRFGRPVQVSVVSGQNFPFYRPAYRDIYYARYETGGGLTQDMFPHLLNAVEWMVGPLTSVTAIASHQVLEGVEVDDTLNLIAKHGEVTASYSMNQFQAPNESTITVVCDKGTARFEYHRSRWVSCSEPGAEWTVEGEVELERDDIFVRQAETFLDLIEESVEDPLCSVAEGRQTLVATLATLESSNTGKTIQL